MKPPEEEILELVAEWVRKADLDFKTGVMKVLGPYLSRG